MEAQGSGTGRFGYDASAGVWEWDRDVYRMHGLDPAAAPELTTDFVLSCKHAEDRAWVADAFRHASQTAEPFSISYRLLGADGVERRVVLVGEGGASAGEGPYDVCGYYVDLTADFDAESSETADQAVAASAEARATIEQAKGALMMGYGLGDDQAFAMLQWWSSERNVKVRDLATLLVEVAKAGELADIDVRHGIDNLLHDAPDHGVPLPD